MNVDDKQVGGDHYRRQSIQPWHAMEAWMTPEEFRGFLRGNAIKYVARAGWKEDDARKDIAKARHYIEKLEQELEKAEQQESHP